MATGFQITLFTAPSQPAGPATGAVPPQAFQAIPIQGTSAVFTGQQASILPRLTANDYVVRLLSRPSQSGPDDIAVLVGEAHAKKRDAASLGEELVAAFPRIGIEGSVKDATSKDGSPSKSAFTHRLFGAFMGRFHTSTIDKAVVEGVPGAHLQFLRGQMQNAVEHAPEIPDGEGLFAEILLKMGSYCRRVILAHEEISRFLDGDDDVINKGRSTDSIESDRDFPGLLPTTGQIVGALTAFGVSIGAAAISGRPAFLVAGGAVALFILRRCIMLKKYLQSEQYEVHDRNGDMAANIDRLMGENTGVGARLYLVGDAHIDGLVELLTGEHGFSEVSLPSTDEGQVALAALPSDIDPDGNVGSNYLLRPPSSYWIVKD